VRQRLPAKERCHRHGCCVLDPPRVQRPHRNYPTRGDAAQARSGRFRESSSAQTYKYRLMRSDELRSLGNFGNPQHAK
jgi:hypothetical protein